jgi:hypothetical protein
MNKHLKIIVCLIVLFFVHCPYGGSAKTRCKIKNRITLDDCLFPLDFIERRKKDTKLSAEEKSLQIANLESFLAYCLLEARKAQACEKISEFEPDFNPEPESPD